MILAVALAPLMLSERGYDCLEKRSCPTQEQVRAAVLEYESERLHAVQEEWENNLKPNEVIIGPHMFVLTRISDLKCTNDAKQPEPARCSFKAVWGKYRESFVADFINQRGNWKIVDAKSIVER